MIAKPDVDALLAGELGGWLAAQQALRDETRAKANRRLAGCIVAGVVIGSLLWALGSDFDTAVVAAGLGLAGGTAWSRKIKRPVITSIKAEMNRAIAGKLGLSYSAVQQAGPEFERALGFGLLPAHDRAAFEDLWSGTINGITMQLYEGHLRQWQQQGKQRQLVTVFHGILIQMVYTRPFHGTTLVERQGARFSFFGLRDSIGGEGRKLERMRMADPRFEDLFDLWSSDFVEGQFLVHPEYIERLIAIEQKFDGHDVRALFHAGEMTILLDTGDQFESGSLDAEEDRARMRKTVEQFVALAELATTLNERPREGPQP